MDNEKFQEIVLKKLNSIEDALYHLSSVQSVLTEVLGNHQSSIVRLRDQVSFKLQEQNKTSWEPYFDVKALDSYCREHLIHPADLTAEEMSQFRLKERQPIERIITDEQ